MYCYIHMYMSKYYLSLNFSNSMPFSRYRCVCVYKSQTTLFSMTWCLWIACTGDVILCKPTTPSSQAPQCLCLFRHAWAGTGMALTRFEVDEPTELSCTAQPIPFALVACLLQILLWWICICYQGHLHTSIYSLHNVQSHYSTIWRLGTIIIAV